jgi:hypothetical protein
MVGTRGAVFIFLLYLLQSSVMIVAGIVALYALQLRFSDLLAMPDPETEPRAAAKTGSN